MTRMPKMLLSATIGALLFAAVPAMAVESQPAKIQVAYTLALKKLAALRVQYQNCYGDLTTKLRSISDEALDYAETYKIMSRSQAVDIVNDEQVKERVRTGMSCGASGDNNDAFFDALISVRQMVSK